MRGPRRGKHFWRRCFASNRAGQAPTSGRSCCRRSTSTVSGLAAMPPNLVEFQISTSKDLCHSPLSQAVPVVPGKLFARNIVGNDRDLWT